MALNVNVVVASVAVAGLMGCASDPNRSVGQRMDDHSVSSRVEDVLGDSPVYKFPHVKVSTYNGVAQLSGFVHQEEQREAATQLAKQAPGVRQVINNISVLSRDAAMGGTRVQGSSTTGTVDRSTTNSTYQPDIRK